MYGAFFTDHHFHHSAAARPSSLFLSLFCYTLCTRQCTLKCVILQGIWVITLLPTHTHTQTHLHYISVVLPALPPFLFLLLTSPSSSPSLLPPSQTLRARPPFVILANILHSTAGSKGAAAFGSKSSSSGKQSQSASSPPPPYSGLTNLGTCVVYVHTCLVNRLCTPVSWSATVATGQLGV